MDNPFSNYGSIVSGRDFVGRAYEIQAVNRRLVNPVDPGNLAIIGDPRVGKSSLAYQALKANEAAAMKAKKCVCWLDLGL